MLNVNPVVEIDYQIRNPDPNCTDDDFYITVTGPAEVLMWNINRGSMRCRPLNHKVHSPVECSDKVLRESYDLVSTRGDK